MRGIGRFPPIATPFEGNADGSRRRPHDRCEPSVDRPIPGDVAIHQGRQVDRMGIAVAAGNVPAVHGP